MGIMFAFGLVMIKMEPPITGRTIHTPNTRAMTLFVFSGRERAKHGFVT
jgi:hypothetical protein